MRQASLTLALVSFAVTGVLVSACGDVEKISPEKQTDVVQTEKKKESATATPTANSTGTVVPKSVQTPMTGEATSDSKILDAVAVSSGSNHTCAVLGTGGLKCWGNNDTGQLGDNSKSDRLLPVAIVGLSTSVKAVSTGHSHSCALLSTGGVKCWGWNYYGQLGDSTSTDRLTPVDVTGLSSGVSGISTSEYGTCALMSTGAVKCWGFSSKPDLPSQPQNSQATKQLTPTGVPLLSIGVTAISSGSSHTCALMDTGGVKCWGYNLHGQLGDNSTSERLTPVDVVGLSSGVTAISAGSSHTCAVMATGGLKCWGLRNDSQILLTPVDVPDVPSGVTAVSAGQSYNCILLNTGSVKCWGHYGNGRVQGASTNGITPVDMHGLSSGVADVSVGSAHSCALLNTGRIKCWGYNGDGQVGDGSTSNTLIPVDVGK